MKLHQTKVEYMMRRALLRALAEHKTNKIVPERLDVIKKIWLLSRSKHQAYMIEGKLERNVYSGDITISFRRFSVPLEGQL